MKRKTNLFYLSGDDNNFISFSNYSESLTGNILATDWKLFPSKFLCIYVKLLDVNNHDSYINEIKPWFIKYLASYYENKLAFLRDYFINNDINVEENILPLNYLLEALYRLPKSYVETIKNYSEIVSNNDDIKISFIGDITEQDYNGIYTDVINVITSSDYAKGDIIVNHNTDISNVEYTDNSRYLYGWTNPNGDYTGPSDYDIAPMFDNTDNGKNNYYSSSCISAISTEKHDSQENIKFNILIPLYDLININKDSNTVKLVEDEKLVINNEEINGIDLLDTDTGYIKNIPIGIWFSETPVELKRDVNTGYSPSWSLLLSSQFKPFPYSQKIPGEVSQNSIKDGYATYSQILVRQNKLLDKLESIISQMNILSNRIDQCEGKLSNIGTSYSVDKMKEELINFENHITKNFNDFKDEVYSKLTNNWKGYIS